MKTKIKPYECLALKYLTTKSNKYYLLNSKPKNKNKINALQYVINHLYIYLGQNNINNRFFPFNLKQYGFINNTSEIIPNFKNQPGEHYFYLNKGGNQYFFPAFYKISETNNQYIVQIDYIYAASENSLEIDNRYISKTPNQNDDATLYFYYKSGNYDGIASLIIAYDFPPYTINSLTNVYYFVRRNGILPKNGVENLSGYTLNNNVITFENNNEECQIIRCKTSYAWKDNPDIVEPKIGDIIFSIIIQITK